MNEECYKTRCNMDDAIDSDEDLPPIFDWRSQNKEATTTAKKKSRGAATTNYRVEDLVWIKYQRSFWPAVVCRTYPKEKKMTVMFVDSPTDKNMLKVPYRRAIAYSSPKSRKMKFEAKNGCDALAEAIDRVEQFLCKRALGGNGISPCKFFKRHYFYVGNVDISESFGDNDDVDKNDDDTKTEESEDDENAEMVQENEEVDDLPDKQQTESSESPVMIKWHDSGNTDNTTTADNTLGPATDEAAKMMEEDLAEKVMAAIETEEYVTFLKAVFDNKVKNERHNAFVNGTTSVRRRLKYEMGFGPFVSASQQDILLKYLLQTFKQQVSPVEHFDINAYLFEVLVPEAIVWALGKVLKISSMDAENAMLQGASTVNY